MSVHIASTLHRVYIKGPHLAGLSYGTKKPARWLVFMSFETLLHAFLIQP